MKKFNIILNSLMSVFFLISIATMQNLFAQNSIEMAFKDVRAILQSDLEITTLDGGQKMYTVSQWPDLPTGESRTIKVMPKAACVSYSHYCTISNESRINRDWTTREIKEAWRPRQELDNDLPIAADIRWMMEYNEWVVNVFITFDAYKDVDLEQARQNIEPLAKTLHEAILMSGLLDDKELSEEDGVFVNAKLSLVQKISNPSDGSRFSPMEVVQYLKIEIEGLDQSQQVPIRAKFEIEKPSRMLYPARLNKLLNGMVEAPFFYSRPTPDRIIKAKATLPKYVFLNSEGTYEASKESQILSIDIRPTCSETKKSAFNRDVFSEMQVDESAIQNDFARVMEEYGYDKLKFSAYPSAKLGMFVANHGGEYETYAGIKHTIRFYTKHEVELNRFIQTQGRSNQSISVKELFKESLRLNRGDVTNALLTCHNVIRAATRGAEDFSDQISESEKNILANYNKGRTREHIKQQQELMTITGQQHDPGILRSLKSIRQENEKSNSGALYHFFATSLASVNSSVSNTPLPVEYTGVLDPIGISPVYTTERKGLEWLIWFEEYSSYTSGDIYTDPTEYCIDHIGLRLGDFIIKKASKARWSKRLEHLKSALTMKSDNKGYYQAVHVKCPIKTTIVDLNSSNTFSFDGVNGEFGGNISMSSYIFPVEDDWEFTCLLPQGDYKVSFDALDEGSFSLYSMDYFSNTGYEFQDIALTTGESFVLDLSSSTSERQLISNKSGTINPELRNFSEGELKKIKSNINLDDNRSLETPEQVLSNNIKEIEKFPNTQSAISEDPQDLQVTHDGNENVEKTPLKLLIVLGLLFVGLLGFIFSYRRIAILATLGFLVTGSYYYSDSLMQLIRTPSFNDPAVEMNNTTISQLDGIWNYRSVGQDGNLVIEKVNINVSANNILGISEKRSLVFNLTPSGDKSFRGQIDLNGTESEVIAFTDDLKEKLTFEIQLDIPNKPTFYIYR